MFKDSWIRITTTEEIDKRTVRLFSAAVTKTMGYQLIENISECSLFEYSDKKNNYLEFGLPKDLTDSQTTEVMEILQRVLPYDFQVEVSGVEPAVNNDVLKEISETAAKLAHNKWMQRQVDEGWRYGAKYSLREKTNPLIQPWEQLTETYKDAHSVNLSEIMDLLGHNGYELIKKR
jgi:hypothetical protein